MRELIYLPERKLENFVFDRPQKWWRKLGVGVTELSIAGFLKAVVNRQPLDKDKADLLNAVILELQREAKRREPRQREQDSIRRFFEDGIIPGQWVYFEAPLNEARLDNAEMPISDFRSTVFYVDVASGFENYPAREGTRLLLHGSIEHSRRTNAPVATLTEFESFGSGSGMDYFYGLACSLADKVHHAPLRGKPGIIKGLGLELDRIDTGQLKRNVKERRSRIMDACAVILNALDSTYEASTAAWISGYAKITMIGRLDEQHTDRGKLARLGGPESNRLIVATPLYVQSMQA